MGFDFKKFWAYMTTDMSKQKKDVPTASISPQPLSSPINKNSLSPSSMTSSQSLPTTIQSNRESTTTKKLTTPLIMFILINSILGSSLFYLPSLGVISAGSASIIAWIILFTTASFMMLYVGELVTLHPTSGGTYEFAKRAYGRFGSFLFGWMLWIAGNLGMALNAIAAAQYFIPGNGRGIFLLQIGFALFWIIVLNILAFRGIDAGATMLVVFGVIATIVVIGMTLPSFVSFPALAHGQFHSPFDKTLMQPFFRAEGLGLISSLLLALFMITEAFFGFDTISYMANETKEPKKLHKPIIWSMVICGVIMILYVLSSLGTVAYHDYVTNGRPFAVQALNTLGVKGEQFITFGMYLVIIGAAAAWPITGSRLIQAMASDKLFPSQLAVLHPKYKSPYRAVYFQTLAVILFTWLIFRGYTKHWKDPYLAGYLIYILLGLVVLAMILLCVPILRKKEPQQERSYKAPFPLLGPLVIVTGIIIVIANWIFIQGKIALSTIQLTASLFILALPVYLFVEMLYDEKAIVKMNEKLSFFVVITEKIFFPLSIKNKLLKDIGNIEGKTLLEYGCSVGTLTKKLAQKVGSKGRIFATDLSLHKVEVAKKRNKEFSHVSVHHHPHLDDFKLELPTQVDGILSIGMLSSMQKPEQILTKLGQHVKKGGEIVFLDYDKFFYVIPNVAWISNDEEVKKMFARAGFNITIERKKSLLWQYVIIMGERV